MIIQFVVTPEQIEYAHKLVKYSMENHRISNIWDSSDLKKDKTFEYRFTGTLGEIIFADAYNLERPNKSFGAVNGQDFGKDFELKVGGKKSYFDIKTMQRKVNSFYEKYVLNIPSSQLNKEGCLTDAYFNISICIKDNLIFASFIGYVERKDILNKKIGIFYPANTQRIRANGTSFTFLEDTYEIDFKDFKPAPEVIENKIKDIKYINLQKN